MSDTAYFGSYVVEHEGFTSTVYHNGDALRVFRGKETSWQDAERYAMDLMLKDTYL